MKTRVILNSLPLSLAMVKPPTRYLIVFSIAMLALLVRILFMVFVSGLANPPQYDEISYDLMAQNILMGKGFSIEETTAFRPPGYPLFLSLIYLVGTNRLVAVRIIQAIIAAFTVLITYQVAWMLFARYLIAILSALMVALHPVLIYLTGLVYSETLEIFLIMSVLLLLTIIRSKEGFQSSTLLLPLGGLLGSIVLIHPSTLFFSVFIIGYVLFAQYRRSISFLKLTIVPLLFAVFMMSWTVRNYLVFNEFIPLTTHGGVTFWAGNNPLGDGGFIEPIPENWIGSDPPQGWMGWPDLTEKESERRFYQAAFNWVAQEPGKFLSLLPKKLLRSWTLTFGNEDRASNLPSWVSVVYLLFPFSAVIGLILSSKFWNDLIPLFLLLISQTMITLIFYGSTRLSSGVVPAMLILSAFAIDKLIRLIFSLTKNHFGGSEQKAILQD